MKEQIQAVIDIGSSQIRVTVARCNEHGDIEVIGCGVLDAPAMKNGIVTDINTTAHALRHAANEAERQSGFEIRNVDAAIGGEHVAGINSDANAYVDSGKISDEEVSRLVAQARYKVSDDNHRILHVLEQQFIVDEHDNIAAPIGMMADRLAAHLHVVRARRNAAQNLIQTIETARIGVNALVFSALASSIAATDADERELGVCVLDIGAGTTDIMAWENGRAAYSGSLNMGGGGDVE